MPRVTHLPRFPGHRGHARLGAPRAVGRASPRCTAASRSSPSRSSRVSGSIRRAALASSSRTPIPTSGRVRSEFRTRAPRRRCSRCSCCIGRARGRCASRRKPPPRSSSTRASGARVRSSATATSSSRRRKLGMLIVHENDGAISVHEPCGRAAHRLPSRRSRRTSDLVAGARRSALRARRAHSAGGVRLRGARRCGVEWFDLDPRDDVGSRPSTSPRRPPPVRAGRRRRGGAVVPRRHRAARARGRAAKDEGLPRAAHRLHRRRDRVRRSPRAHHLVQPERAARLTGYTAEEVVGRRSRSGACTRRAKR